MFKAPVNLDSQVQCLRVNLLWKCWDGVVLRSKAKHRTAKLVEFLFSKLVVAKEALGNWRVLTLVFGTWCRLRSERLKYETLRDGLDYMSQRPEVGQTFEQFLDSNGGEKAPRTQRTSVVPHRQHSANDDSLPKISLERQRTLENLTRRIVFTRWVELAQQSTLGNKPTPARQDGSKPWVRWTANVGYTGTDPHGAHVAVADLPSVGELFADRQPPQRCPPQVFNVGSLADASLLAPKSFEFDHASLGSDIDGLRVLRVESDGHSAFLADTGSVVDAAQLGRDGLPVSASSDMRTQFFGEDLLSASSSTVAGAVFRSSRGGDGDDQAGRVAPSATNTQRAAKRFEVLRVNWDGQAATFSRVESQGLDTPSYLESFASSEAEDSPL